MAGVVYYTEVAGRHRVVATPAGPEGRPIRFAATLAAGEQLFVGVPGLAGTAGAVVVLAREGDALSVDRRHPAGY